MASHWSWKVVTHLHAHAGVQQLQPVVPSLAQPAVAHKSQLLGIGQHVTFNQRSEGLITEGVTLKRRTVPLQHDRDMAMWASVGLGPISVNAVPRVDSAEASPMK